MVVINLYGILAEVAQRSFTVHVHSFDEAMRALMANFPKLRKTIHDMRISMLVNGEAMTFEDCLRPYTSETIDIMPIVGGAGPAVMIVVGAIAAYGAGAIAAYVGTALVLSAAVTAALATAIMQFGIALIMGGISQALFKPPKQDLSSAGMQRQDETPSYIFNGAINVSTQGGIVPVGFGRMRVGSQVISANVQTWDIPVNPATTPSAPTQPPPPPESWTSRSVELA